LRNTSAGHLHEDQAMDFKVTTAAEKFVRRMIRFNGGGGLRLAVTAGGCSGLAAQFEVEGAPRAEDSVYEHKDLTFFLPAESRLLLDGVTVDFRETATESGFVFHDPKQASCGCKSTHYDAVAEAIAHTLAH
jgi:iron-sulfur cluster assembly accessory protein